MSGKNRMTGAVILVFSILPASGRAGPVWNTGFENGFPAEAITSGNWSVVTSNLAAHSGSRGANITGLTDPSGDVLTLAWPSVGFQDLNLEFWSKVRGGLETEDQVLIQLTIDGVTWTTLDTRTDAAAGDWSLSTFTLPVAATNNPTPGFRFEAMLSSSGDRWALDDITLSGQPVSEPTTVGLLTLGVLAVARRYLFRPCF